MILVFKKYRFVIATLVFAAILLTIIVGLFSIDNSTNRMICEYVESLGWKINSSPTEISHLTIPEEFDAVYETYNAVQISSGFDLTPFKGKNVVRYSYKVLNHNRSQDSEVIVSVFVYDSRIIAADICSTDMNGFMHGITETVNIKNQ